MPTIIHVVGARPNYVKVSPIWHAVRARASHVTQVLVDTGQHYDDDMAGVFRRDLGLPAPDWSLNIGSNTREAQIAGVRSAFADVRAQVRPALIVVVGDVNSTLAAAEAAADAHVPLAHVEAGLRSFDWSMPEEHNRVATDRLSDILLTPSLDANANLEREGIAASRVHFVGNVMIDSLLAHRAAAGFQRVSARFPVSPGQYAVCTLHRPGNVDRREVLGRLLEGLDAVARRMPVVWPMHPRTRRRIEEFGLDGALARIHLSAPLGYLDFLALTSHARAVVTDSGGLQEEAVVLGIPCVTVRPNTERPITLTGGANRLVTPDARSMLEGLDAALSSPPVSPPPLWDGHTAARIVDVLLRAVPTLTPDAAQAVD